MTKICYYGDKISEHISKTPEGFLVCQSVPIARTGYQQYLDSELSDSGDPDEIINVFRSPEEVFSRATLASFEGKPVCNGHPDVDVTPENYDQLACGHVQHVRIGTGEDADKILADLYITDPELIDEITNGKREVSAGYYAEDNKDNYGRICQINIRGNHVAVVDKGRAGRTVCIRDSEMKPQKGGRLMKLSLVRKLRRYLVDAEPSELAERLDDVSEILDADEVDMMEDEDMIDDEDLLEDEDMIDDEDDIYSDEDMIDDEDDVYADEDMIDDEDDVYADEDDIFTDEDLFDDEDDIYSDSCKKDSCKRDACKRRDAALRRINRSTRLDEDIFVNEDVIEDEDDVMTEDEEDEILDEEFNLMEDEDDITEDAELVEADIKETPVESKDAALKRLSKVARKISNRHDRAMMQNAIIKASGKKSQMPGLLKATREAKARRDASYISMNVEQQQNVYDAMNPHKNPKR